MRFILQHICFSKYFLHLYQVADFFVFVFNTETFHFYNRHSDSNIAQNKNNATELDEKAELFT